MRKMRFVLCLALAAAMLTACGAGTESNSDVPEAAPTEAQAAEIPETLPEPETDVQTVADMEEEEDEENYNTGDASLDNPRNQDEIGKQELLVISFGTSFNDSRRLTIGAIEDTLEGAFPEFAVRRGFTSNIIIDHVQSRDGILIDDVNAALTRAADNGVKTLVVQPTHLINGLEYNDLVNEVAQFADAFEQVAIGEPLLTSEEDFQRTVEAIVDWTAAYDDGETAINFMGHGGGVQWGL